MMLRAQKRGFTLMEILVAISVFAVIIVTSTSVYINITREYKRSNLHNGIYEDGRLLLEKITALGRQYTIDYEEYYSQLVVQKDAADRIYGLNYGVYGSRFYDPGLTIKSGSPQQGEFPEDLGTECGDGTEKTEDPPKECVIYIPSLDNNSGKNPYNNDANWAAAVCNGDCDNPLAKESLQPELYLISNDGTRKIIFALEKVSATESALAMVELVGTDTDNNGVVDEYTCDIAKGYECTGAGGLPSSKDLSTTADSTNGNKLDFVPVSSLNTQVAQLNFLVAPLEDPRKAFNEKDKYIQMQPHFTVMLTVQPTAEAQEKINFGDTPVMTLQTSVTPRVYNEVKSYPPIKDIGKLKGSLPAI